MASDLAVGAKKILSDFVPQIDAKLEIIWKKELQDVFGFNEGQKAIALEMLKHSQEHNLAPSKRVRSAFVVYGWMLGQKGGVVVPEGVWTAAAAIELVHTAILMQDDFMDEDTLRRGKQTTNAFFQQKYGRHYGDVMAINTGDTVLCLGFELLARCGLRDDLVLAAMVHLQRTVARTAIGQAHDVTMEFVNQWSEDDVIAVHSAKTGLYTYQNPLYIGGILGEVSEEVLHILKQYSQDGGVAFQIQDDILGVFGDTKDTGKSADSDLLQGKRTLLVLKTLEMGTMEQVEALKTVLGKKDATALELAAAKKAIVDSGALEYNRQKAIYLAKRSAKTAENLRDMRLNTEAVDFIQGVAEYMVERKV